MICRIDSPFLPGVQYTQFLSLGEITLLLDFVYFTQIFYVFINIWNYIFFISKLLYNKY